MWAKSFRFFGVLAILALGFALLGAQNGSNTSQKEVSYFPARDDIRNAEFTVEISQTEKGVKEGVIKLKDGLYEHGFGPDHLLVKATDDYAIGDINDDGLWDAVVVLVTERVGSLIPSELAGLINDGTRLKHVSTFDLGDRTDVDSIAIKDGVITMNILIHGPDDPMCCPTVKEPRRFSFKDGKIVRLPN